MPGIKYYALRLIYLLLSEAKSDSQTCYKNTTLKGRQLID